MIEDKNPSRTYWDRLPAECRYCWGILHVVVQQHQRQHTPPDIVAKINIFGFLFSAQFSIIVVLYSGTEVSRKLI